MLARLDVKTVRSPYFAGIIASIVWMVGLAILLTNHSGSKDIDPYISGWNDAAAFSLACIPLALILGWRGFNSSLREFFKGTPPFLASIAIIDLAALLLNFFRLPPHNFAELFFAVLMLSVMAIPQTMITLIVLPLAVVLGWAYHAFSKRTMTP